MGENQTTYTYEVKPMTCSGCTKAVEKALNNLGGMESINFDLEKMTVVVKTATKSSDEIVEAIKKTGKTVKIIE